MTAPNITELREQLLATLADLRNRENPMEPDRARAIAAVAGVLVDSAKTEVEYLRVTKQDRSDFLEAQGDNVRITDETLTRNTPFPGRVHRLQG